jgi:hypothetical protein
VLERELGRVMLSIHVEVELQSFFLRALNHLLNSRIGLGFRIQYEVTYFDISRVDTAPILDYDLGVRREASRTASSLTNTLPAHGAFVFGTLYSVRR